MKKVGGEMPTGSLSKVNAVISTITFHSHLKNGAELLHNRLQIVGDDGQSYLLPIPRSENTIYY